MVAPGCAQWPAQRGGEDLEFPKAAWGLWTSPPQPSSSVSLSSLATFLTCANVEVDVIKLSPVKQRHQGR